MSGPVGYIYHADLYCPQHILAAMGESGQPGKSVDEQLAHLAKQRGIDLSQDYDSGEFPAPYVGTPHDGCTADNGYEPGQCGNQCAVCHEPLGYDCPNTKEGR